MIMMIILFSLLSVSETRQEVENDPEKRAKCVLEKRESRDQRERKMALIQSDNRFSTLESKRLNKIALQCFKRRERQDNKWFQSYLYLFFSRKSSK